MKKTACSQNIALGQEAEELQQPLKEPSWPEGKLAAAGPHHCPPAAGVTASEERCTRTPAPGGSRKRATRRTAAAGALELQETPDSPA